MSESEMTSNRPYLIRALYEWIADNDMTPHLLANAEHPDISVPPGSEQEGKVVLNASMSAVRGLELGNEYISFNARFSGAPFDVLVPIDAVLAIYARENGQGMLFPQDDEEEHDQDETTTDGAGNEEGGDDDDDPPPSGRPNLKVVK